MNKVLRLQVGDSDLFQSHWSIGSSHIHLKKACLQRQTGVPESLFNANKQSIPQISKIPPSYRCMISGKPFNLRGKGLSKQHPTRSTPPGPTRTALPGGPRYHLCRETRRGMSSNMVAGQHAISSSWSGRPTSENLRSLSIIIYN